MAKQSNDARLIKLLNEYGFSLRGKHLYSKGIKGILGERLIAIVRGPFDACEQVMPLLDSAEREIFYKEWNRPTE